ncbi:hypothetical protein J6W34_07075 [bacterium]|nr:hypothetical protein [bacterium]
MDIWAIKAAGKERKANLLQKETERENGKQSYSDDRFWTLDYDKNTKVGKAIIRPIGPSIGEEDEYVTEYTHFIRRNNKILSVKCPTTEKHKCPICEYYFSKDKDDRDNNFARNTKFIMNILVVKDFQHPENDGKVFLYKCPVSVMNKIREALKDKDEMDMPKESVNVFDMWEGANINLITKDKGGFLNYDSSTIASKTPIFEDVDNGALYEELYKKLYSLKEFKVAPTTEEIREKFDTFMNGVDTSVKNVENHVRAEQKEVLSENNIEDVIDDEIPEEFGGVSATGSKVDESTVSEDDFWNNI